MHNKNHILDNLLFVTHSDYQCTLSQLYHENSKIGRKKYEMTSSVQSMAAMKKLCQLISGKGKDYTFYPYVDINSTYASHLQRRSIRHFSGKPLVKDIIDVVFDKLLAFQLDDQQYRRGYPSAGGLYPIEIYPLLMNIEQCEPGLYYLDVFYHRLMQLKKGMDIEKVKSMFMGEEIVLSTNLIILISAVLPRLHLKYGERAYRYAHLEAGHVAQVILDQCHHHHLNAFPVVGFIEREMELYLDIDGQEEIAVYSIFIGQSNAQT